VWERGFEPYPGCAGERARAPRPQPAGQRLPVARPVKASSRASADTEGRASAAGKGRAQTEGLCVETDPAREGVDPATGRVDSDPGGLRRPKTEVEKTT